MTTAGVVYGGVAQGQGQHGGPGGNSGRIVFTPLVKTATVGMVNMPAVLVDF